MSYDIKFKVRVADTDAYITVKESDANITWNVREIIKNSTGLPWINEANNGLCLDVIPKIQEGITELVRNGEKYKTYEPDNKWGSVEGTVRFFRTIVSDWNDFVVSNDPAVVAVTTFWVV